MKRTRPVHARIGSSCKGLAEAWRREIAIRTHVRLSSAGLLVLVWTSAPLPWTLACAVLMLAGLAAELINAAVEAMLDRLHPGFDREIGAAKDMCSAAAFALNVAAGAAFAGGVAAGASA